MLKLFRMNKLIFSLAVISVIFISSSCNHSSTTIYGNWVKLSGFDGDARRSAVAFVINNEAYLGTGYDGENRMNDFWKYNVAKDYWVQIDSFPGVARNSAVAFATDSKGYVGTGFDGVHMLSDFWAYDPVTNKWDSIAPFEGNGKTARYSAIAFCINNIGYVGTGYDNKYKSDFYAYHPETNTWDDHIASLGGLKRRDAACFVIDDTAYVCTGTDNGQYLVDLNAYDPNTNTWIRKRDIDNTSPDSYDDIYANAIKRSMAVGFATNGKGFIATGSQSSVLGTVWEYDPLTDLWDKKNPLEGSARAGAVAFVLSGVPYICTGANGSSYFDDLWSFYPADLYNQYDK